MVYNGPKNLPSNQTNKITPTEPESDKSCSVKVIADILNYADAKGFIKVLGISLAMRAIANVMDRNHMVF